MILSYHFYGLRLKQKKERFHSFIVEKCLSACSVSCSVLRVSYELGRKNTPVTIALFSLSPYVLFLQLILQGPLLFFCVYTQNSDLFLIEEEYYFSHEVHDSAAFFFFVISEFCVLTSMAYDCYVAIFV